MGKDDERAKRTRTPPQGVEIVAEAVREEAASPWEIRESRIDDIATRLLVLEEINRQVSGMAQLLSQFVVPTVKATQAGLTDLSVSHATHRQRLDEFLDYRWPRAEESLKSIDSRVDRVERNQERQDSDIKRMNESLSSSAATVNKRLESVESNQAQLALRVVSLEDASKQAAAEARGAQKLLGKQKVVIGAVAAVIGFVMSQAKAIVGWLAG